MKCTVYCKLHDTLSTSEKMDQEDNAVMTLVCMVYDDKGGGGVCMRKYNSGPNSCHCFRGRI